MKIKIKGYKKELDVYAIAIYTKDDWVFGDRIVLYFTEENLVGLSAEKISNVEVIDDRIGSDFSFQAMDDGQGFMILSSHFSDSSHLARLLDLEPQTLSAFEAARALPAPRNKR